MAGEKMWLERLKIKKHACINADTWEKERAEVYKQMLKVTSGFEDEVCQLCNSESSTITFRYAHQKKKKNK